MLKIIKKKYHQYLLFLILLQYSSFQGICDSISSNNTNFPVNQAAWISHDKSSGEYNEWVCFATDFNLDAEVINAITDISVDSQYWLWINGKLVKRFGGVKRGPNPFDTYFDRVNLKDYFVKGNNRIAILLNYYGNHGFSHNSSGKDAIYFSSNIVLEGSVSVNIVSSEQWKTKQHISFYTPNIKRPNFRLPEANVGYNGSDNFGFDWVNIAYNLSAWENAVVINYPPNKPWGNLVLRPIPAFISSDLKSYNSELKFPFISNGKPIVCNLPYNAQVSPYLKVKSKEKVKIRMRTDHFIVTRARIIEYEYITGSGIQEFECFGWINGDKVIYFIPKGVEVLDLKYRESGYDSKQTGTFVSSDKFINTYVKKAARTLYVGMRDTYMDCPDRERSQWWGDVVNVLPMADFLFDNTSSLLAKKGILELAGWQRSDGIIYSPVPSGKKDNFVASDQKKGYWEKELPDQMLYSVGYYGFYYYLLSTGDVETIKTVLPSVKKYLATYELDEKGFPKVPKRNPDQSWHFGDWSWDKVLDYDLMIVELYYLALKGFVLMAETTGMDNIITVEKDNMLRIENNFDSRYWNGTCYQSPNYKKVDERVSALAVCAGLANHDKYEKIAEILSKEQHASPYIEHRIMEAYFIMGKGKEGLERFRKRFSKMVVSSYSTLWEGWKLRIMLIPMSSTNHPWAGASAAILYQQMLGIKILEPAYKKFAILPQMGGVEKLQASFDCAAGLVSVKINEGKSGFNMEITIPEKSEAVIGIPSSYEKPETPQGAVFTNKDDKFYYFSVKGRKELFVFNATK